MKTQTSSPNDNYIEIPAPKLNISELNEIKCVRPKDDEGHIIVYCEPISNYRGACPNCGSRNYYVHGRNPDRIVHDINMGLTQVDLVVKTPRYLCNDCGRSFTHPFNEIKAGQQFTTRLYEQIKKRALNGPFLEISRDYGISNVTVANILSEYGKELEADYHPVAPRVLGIDEKHIVKSARGVLVNIETGKLLNILPNNKRETMMHGIMQLFDYEKNIKIVTMDMTSGYASMVQECLPYAKIIIDKYHVVQDLYRKTEKTRKAIYEYLKDQVKAMDTSIEKEYKAKLLTRLGKNVYLFKFGNKKLAEKKSRISLMAELCETFPELNMLRLLKEGAERIYTAHNRKEAEEFYTDWVALIPFDNELFSEYEVMFRTMERWKKYIFNYFDEDCQFTNATTEGLNSLIGHLNDQGRGYKFETLRIKCLFHTSAMDKPRRELRKRRVYDFSQINDDYVSMNFSGFGSLTLTPQQYREETHEVFTPGTGTDIAILLDLFENEPFL